MESLMFPFRNLQRPSQSEAPHHPCPALLNALQWLQAPEHDGGYGQACMQVLLYPHLSAVHRDDDRIRILHVYDHADARPHVYVHECALLHHEYAHGCAHAHDHDHDMSAASTSAMAVFFVCHMHCLSILLLISSF